MLSQLTKAHEEHLPAILEDIGTNPEQLKKDVASMREWYTYQTHLPQCIDDHVLASFIVGCKNSIEKAKVKLDMYYSQRRNFEEIYKDCDPESEDLVKSYKTVYTLVLPGLTPDGTSVSILKLKNTDPSVYNPMDPVKRLNMIYEILLKTTTMTSRNYFVYDYEGCTNAHVAQLNPLMVKTHIDTLKFLPIRVQGLIAINCPKVAEKAYNLMKNFMSEKLSSRIFIYAEDASVLTKHIPAKILPKSYGGEADYTLESLNDFWHETLVGSRDWFLNESLHYSDETKRPAESKFNADGDTFGMDGSFKKLALD